MIIFLIQHTYHCIITLLLYIAFFENGYADNVIFVKILVKLKLLIRDDDLRVIYCLFRVVIFASSIYTYNQPNFYYNFFLISINSNNNKRK